ncbi:hypothetical protein [Planomonospora parontospora]|uniref:hypothetical protein n=1 Tax=Planomonospora parontospora TaxID=58119 RepID=UPI001671612E|nr:hypothetical protein [Planomonospora parontospora]GGL55706.1 hypothetical protein GCM10014719_66220 [Planomonospora parontospora subsp. antibiotica]GII19835.1 hypothetical protein Ppa05_65610 [Planomonospora parontospora subsp. antibiotica]
MLRSPVPARRTAPARRTGTVTAALLAAALTACGGVGANDGEKGGAVSLTTMGFGLPDEIATVRVDAFRKAHPGTALTINQGQFDEQAFLSAVAGGNPPDVVYLGRDRIGSYAARGRSNRWTAA